MSINHQSKRDANEKNSHAWAARKAKSRNNLRRYFVSRIGKIAT